MAISKGPGRGIGRAGLALTALLAAGGGGSGCATLHETGRTAHTAEGMETLDTERAIDAETQKLQKEFREAEYRFSVRFLVNAQPKMLAQKEAALMDALEKGIPIEMPAVREMMPNPNFIQDDYYFALLIAPILAEYVDQYGDTEFTEEIIAEYERNIADLYTRVYEASIAVQRETQADSVRGNPTARRRYETASRMADAMDKRQEILSGLNTSGMLAVTGTAETPTGNVYLEATKRQLGQIVRSGLPYDEMFASAKDVLSELETLEGTMGTSPQEALAIVDLNQAESLVIQFQQWLIEQQEGLDRNTETWSIPTEPPTVDPSGEGVSYADFNMPVLVEAWTNPMDRPDLTTEDPDLLKWGEQAVWFRQAARQYFGNAVVHGMSGQVEAWVAAEKDSKKPVPFDPLDAWRYVVTKGEKSMSEIGDYIVARTDGSNPLTQFQLLELDAELARILEEPDAELNSTRVLSLLLHARAVDTGDPLVLDRLRGDAHEAAVKAVSDSMSLAENPYDSTTPAEIRGTVVTIGGAMNNAVTVTSGSIGDPDNRLFYPVVTVNAERIEGDIPEFIAGNYAEIDLSQLPQIMEAIARDGYARQLEEAEAKRSRPGGSR